MARALLSRRAMGLRALIVEDHVATLVALREYFEAAGFRVDGAGSLAEALELAGRHRYALAITDLRLERGGAADGLDVVSAVHVRDPRTVIVLLTAQATPAMADEARRRGAVAVLPKPQPLPRLLGTARALLGRAAAPLRD